MKTKHLSWILILVTLFFITSCTKEAVIPPPEEEEEEAVIPPSEEEEDVSVIEGEEGFSSLAGQNALKSSNLSEIEAVYCQGYENDPSNAEAAFGCFLVMLAQMFESQGITDFLAALNEPAINVQSNILDPENPNALCTKLAAQTPMKYYEEFPQLPFNAYRFSMNYPGGFKEGFKEFFEELLKRAKNNNIVASRIQDDLFALDQYLDELIALLTVSRGVSDFSFTLPRELCGASDRDIVIRRIDLEGFHAALGSIKIFVNLLHAYTIGLDPARFVNGDDDFVLRTPFVDDANGVGGDIKKFAELIPGREDLSALKPLMMSTLNSIITFLGTVEDSSDSEVFGYLLTDRKFSGFFDKVEKAAKDLKYSLENPGLLTPLTHLECPTVSLNVNRFLEGLPDPKVVGVADPVVDPFTVSPITGKIEIVTDFFEILFAEIATFEHD